MLPSTSLTETSSQPQRSAPASFSMLPERPQNLHIFNPLYLLRHLPPVVRGKLQRRGRILRRYKAAQTFSLVGNVLFPSAPEDESSSLSISCSSGSAAPVGPTTDFNGAGYTYSVRACERLDERTFEIGALVLEESGQWDPKSEATFRFRAPTEEQATSWCDALQAVLVSRPPGSLARDFEPLGTLGKGGYGRVARVRCLRTGDTVALKAVPKSPARKRNRAPPRNEEEALEQYIRHLQFVVQERSTMQWASKYNHPHVNKLVCAFETGSHYFLGIEFCAGGDMYKTLKTQPNKRFHESVMRVWAAQLISAIQHLHAMRIVHRDIKPENLFLDEDGALQLGDFGLASVLHNGTCRRAVCGTKYYIAPEVISSSGDHNQMVDYWAVGILLFEMLTGEPPFKAKRRSATFSLIRNCELHFPADGPELSPEVRDIILRLLDKNPNSRLGANPHDVRQHAFFKEIDWAAVDAGESRSLYVPRVRHSASRTSSRDNSSASSSPHVDPSSMHMSRLVQSLGGSSRGNSSGSSVENSVEDTATPPASFASMLGLEPSEVDAPLDAVLLQGYDFIQDACSQRGKGDLEGVVQ